MDSVTNKPLCFELVSKRQKTQNMMMTGAMRAISPQVFLTTLVNFLDLTTALAWSQVNREWHKTNMQYKFIQSVYIRDNNPITCMSLTKLFSKYTQQIFPSIDHLQLGYNPENLSIEEIFTRVPNIQKLRFGDQPEGFTDDNLHFIENLTNLKTLDLSWSRVSDYGLYELRTFTTIQSLNLYMCPRITDVGISF